MTNQDILQKVTDIIVDVLVIDENKVQPTSRLIADLGAESIDFLDLVFQLEKEFSIKIPRGQLEKNARGDLTEEEFEQNVRLKPIRLYLFQQHQASVQALQHRPYFSAVPHSKTAIEAFL
jgi:acyl carrier protein